MSKVRGIKAIVDRGHYLDGQLKAMLKEMDQIKKAIREHAKATNQPYIKGITGKVTVGDYAKSKIDPLVAWVSLNKKIEVFKNVITVNIGQIKSYLDKATIEKIIEKNTEQFHTVKFHNIDDSITIPNGRLLRRIDSGE